MPWHRPLVSAKPMLASVPEDPLPEGGVGLPISNVFHTQQFQPPALDFGNGLEYINIESLADSLQPSTSGQQEFSPMQHFGGMVSLQGSTPQSLPLQPGARA